MADGLRGSKKKRPSEEALIPNLPDEVSWLCLARISHGYEGVMQCVCRRWRDAFRSKKIGWIRAREGLSGDWLFVHTCLDLNVDWQAYDPSANRWHPLPYLDEFFPHIGFRCAILNRRLLFLGGLCGPFSDVVDYLYAAPGFEEEPSNRVFCFDPFFRKWIELAGMNTPRAFFACAVIDGRAIVAGGGTASAESFDPVRNIWDPLPEMPEVLYLCRAVTHNGWFQVLGEAEDGSPRHFILNGRQWMLAPSTHELPSMPAKEMMQVDGQLYGILNEGLALLDENTREWRILCKPPYFGMPHPERWIPECVGFTRLNGRFYLVGGSDTDSRAAGRGFVDFTAVRYCDPFGGTPVSWHDAPPLLSDNGIVLACTALQQE